MRGERAVDYYIRASLYTSVVTMIFGPEKCTEEEVGGKYWGKCDCIFPFKSPGPM